MLYMQGELQSRQIAEKGGCQPYRYEQVEKEGNWEMLRAHAIKNYAGGTDTQSLHADMKMNKAIVERGDKGATSAEAIIKTLRRHRQNGRDYGMQPISDKA